MSTKKDLTVLRTYDLVKPAEAVAMAVVLKNYIIEQGLYTNIKGKNYVHVEGWAFAGFLSGMNAIIEEPKNLSNDKEIKWSCEARVYHGEKMIGRGYALCSNREVIKKGFDEYAILSMAQTRCLGKAYRNIIGWIMKMAGFAGTPAEEMAKVGQDATLTPKAPYVGKQGVKTTTEKPAEADSPAKEKLFALARENGAVAGKEHFIIGTKIGLKVNWAKCSESALQKIYSLYLSKIVK